MIDFKVYTLLPECEKAGIPLTEEAVKKLNAYGNLLLEWNEKMNLTAITEPGEVLYKHFYDCLLFFAAADVKEGAKIIDVGTGAGFPGIVLKIARPDIEITLLDGLNKRIAFLNDVLLNLGIKGETVHMRAEDGGRNPAYREKFDIATARAVANLSVLSEYCVPFVKPGGIFVAMKGGEPEAEAATGTDALKILGCEAPIIIRKDLREGEKRSFIIAKKISQTPPKYPRNSAKISKAAL